MTEQRLQHAVEEALKDLQAAACTYSLFLRRSTPEERELLARRLTEAAVANSALEVEIMAALKEEHRR